MGSSSSKFRKHLQNGDEVAALNLYNNHSDLRKALDPNCSYGDNYQHETPFLYAARHGMKSLLRIFLHDHGGNPNKTNSRKETAVHCVCMEKNAQFYPVHKRRLECLTMLLQWRGATLKDGEVEKADLGALDEKNNTALHYAAASGLKACVESMVQHGSPLFQENVDNQTPCDCAESSGHGEIALYLESKMVFSNDPNCEGIEEVPEEIDAEQYSGLRAQDLQEAKDQLLVETADMLSVPLFTAEALLRNHEWSREMLLDAWMKDALACCEKCGVTPPTNLFSEKPVVAESLNSPTLSEPPAPDAVCDICTCSFLITEEPVHMSCQHQFCRECWESYLNLKIQEGDAHHITCPAFECDRLVPVEIIENIVSRDMARRYLQFDIKAFVDSNPSIKWCPYPGCGRAVRFPEIDTVSASATSPRHSAIPNDTSRAVDCGNGHYFCWECLGEAHEPCSCDNLQKWKQKIAEIKPETLNGTEQETESAANCLWLVTNSKPCPNCKSPIQKNEGCNHMKCSKCKYDFCWVCLDQWKRHNSSTGGYFKCNRYEVTKKVEVQSQTAQDEAEKKNTHMQELNKFVHYYTRYKNHENSYKLEEPLLSTAKEKMMKLAAAVTDIATAKAETKFVEEAVHQLLKARRVLKCSYVYGYYLDGPGYRKIVFEFMQTELEECTEILSQMVNRLYLRTPRKKIIEQSQICYRKRHEFIVAISKGLVPPETPPGLRKHRRHKFSMETEDEDLRKAILASIQDVDSANPWIVDASGRHTNIAALLDWPSDSDDSDVETPSYNTDTSELCAREGCRRPRAKNPRTGEFHEYCSIKCSKKQKQTEDEEVPEVILDEHMDFLRALELSRLQYLREQGLMTDGSDDSSELMSSGEAGAGVGGQRRSHGKSQVADNRDDLCSPAERLDLELQRLLELSSISPIEDLSREKDSQPADNQTTSPADEWQKHLSASTLPSENNTTIVSRVPNKSVEDLYHSDCFTCPGAQGLPPQPSPSKPLSVEVTTPRSGSGLGFNDLEELEVLGACGGGGETSETSTLLNTATGTLPGVGLGSESLHRNRNYDFSTDDLPVGGHVLKKLLNTDKLDMNYPEFPSTSSQFGAIKDLSVSNIHVSEKDKTKDFLSKDMSALTRSEPKKTKQGPAQFIAANTPGEDEKVFSLFSPESEFSESAVTDSWDYQHQASAQLGDDQTESDVSFDWPTPEGADSCHILDGSKAERREHHTFNKEENLKELEQISIVELTENLLQMTSDMENVIDTGDLDDQHVDSGYLDGQNVMLASPMPSSGQTWNFTTTSSAQLEPASNTGTHTSVWAEHTSSLSSAKTTQIGGETCETQPDSAAGKTDACTLQDIEGGEDNLGTQNEGAEVSPQESGQTATSSDVPMGLSGDIADFISSVIEDEDHSTYV